MIFSNARFSREKRVKLIFICIIPIFAALLLYNFTSFSEGYTEPLGRINLIRTSKSEDNYSVFEANGKTVSARGKYSDDRLRKLFIDKDNGEFSGSYSMRAHEDGGYEAEITMQPPEEGEHRLSLLLNSGAVMRYFIFYDNERGWYFPENGYGNSNPTVFDHIFEAPEEAAALYLSPTKDANEIATALEQIKMLAEQTTAGIEDDYEKARAISRFISERVYYDYDARDSGVDVSTVAICNVLKTARTVCAGFTNLFCAMAEAVGIDAVNIKGGIVNEDMRYSELEKGQQNHEWSAFWYEKEQRWVWVDSCWDGCGTYRNGTRTPGKPKYMYFDISDEALSLNHRADKAERRHYFAAKPETALLGTTAEEGDANALITSEPANGGDAETTTLPAVTAPVTTKETPESEKSSDAVYITVIAALSAAVIATAVILVIIIVKGRKQ